jgi:hypothetical protein
MENWALKVVQGTPGIEEFQLLFPMTRESKN